MKKKSKFFWLAECFGMGLYLNPGLFKTEREAQKFCAEATLGRGVIYSYRKVRLGAYPKKKEKRYDS